MNRRKRRTSAQTFPVTRPVVRRSVPSRGGVPADGAPPHAPHVKQPRCHLAPMAVTYPPNADTSPAAPARKPGEPSRRGSSVEGSIGRVRIAAAAGGEIFLLLERPRERLVVDDDVTRAPSAAAASSSAAAAASSSSWPP